MFNVDVSLVNVCSGLFYINSLWFLAWRTRWRDVYIKEIPAPVELVDISVLTGTPRRYDATVPRRYAVSPFRGFPSSLTVFH